MARKRKVEEVFLPTTLSTDITSKDQTLDIMQVGESVNSLMTGLQEQQEVAALAARHNDLRYIRKMDEIIDKVLTAFEDVIVEDPENLKEAMRKVLKKGDMIGFKNLMVALGVAYEKREQLLSFDSTRAQKQGNFTYEAVWVNKEGEKVGVKVKSG